MKKVATFSGVRVDIQRHINHWFKENQNVDIIDIKQNMDGGYLYVSIFYENFEEDEDIDDGNDN